jgi:hypothetical protein
MSGGKLRAALIKLIYDTIPPGITGKVKSVDESDFTCVVTPSNGGPDYEGVRLKSSIDSTNEGMVTIPDVNSEVIICPLMNNDHNYYVSRFSKVKKWYLKTTSGKFIEILDTGAIKINGSTFGGIPKAANVSLHHNNNTAKINAFIAAFIAWAPVPNDGGAALKLALASAIATTVSTTSASDYENTNVQHG